MKPSNLSILLAALAISSLSACSLISFDGYVGEGKKSDGGSIVCSNPTKLETGDDFVCVLKADATLWCWGSNANGQVGNNPKADPGTGRYPDVPRATQVLFPGNEKIVEFSAGGYFACAIDQSASLWCWGKGLFGQTGQTPIIAEAGVADGGSEAFDVLTPKSVGASLAKDVSAVSLGWEHACAIRKSDQTVWCWGKNDTAQLGVDLTTKQSSEPIQIQLPGKAKSISAGSFHTCAVLEDTTAWCWGKGSNGQLGYGGVDQQVSPVQVAGPNSKPVSDGGTQEDADQEAGLPETGTPETGSVPPLDGIISVASGAAQSCALRTNGYSYCWGSCKFGEMGDNRTKDVNCVQPVPKQVPLPNVTQISSGVFNVCATTSDSKGHCWGRDDWGQSGNGSPITGSLSEPDGIGTPTQVVPLGDKVVSMNPGYNHACALLKDNTVQCWGRNKAFQLGNGVSSDPVDPEKNNSLLPVISVAACQ